MANIKYRGFASYRHKSPQCLHPTKQQKTCTDETANGLLSEVHSLGLLRARKHIRVEPTQKRKFCASYIRSSSLGFCLPTFDRCARELHKTIICCVVLPSVLRWRALVPSLVTVCKKARSTNQRKNAVHYRPSTLNGAH